MMTMMPSTASSPSRVKAPCTPSRVGMATGPVLGGLIFDRFGDYGWLYLGSCGVGIGAFLIALTFRPFPREKLETAAVA